MYNLLLFAMSIDFPYLNISLNLIYYNDKITAGLCKNPVHLCDHLYMSQRCVTLKKNGFEWIHQEVWIIQMNFISPAAQHSGIFIIISYVTDIFEGYIIVAGRNCKMFKCVFVSTIIVRVS